MKKNIMKRKAAIEALKLVSDGMVIGLGSGTTINIFLKLLYEKIKREELDIYFVPTSTDVETALLNYGLNIVTLNEYPEPSIAIDGADAVTKTLDLIKGGGGALTREKIVDYSSKEYYIIVDETKIFDNLYKHFIPLEVLPFAWKRVLKDLKEMFNVSGNLRICGKGKLGPVITDNGNYIIDIYYNNKTDPSSLEIELNIIPGILENGIFSRKKPKKIIVGSLKKTYTIE